VKELVFATRNPDKIREIQDILASGFRILSLEDMGVTEDIPEDHHTLEENALYKAEFVYKKFGVDCFADDTGLEVAALKGAPGVYSARYASLTGELHEGESISAANIRKLLRMMEGVTDRRARFRTVIALVRQGDHYLFEGTVSGHIIHQPRGEEGFGYDPVFCPDNSTRTFAEMSLAEKNKISHRSRAINQLSGFLMRGRS
jgi:XTP/dITP diphosphohydrolase